MSRLKKSIISICVAVCMCFFSVCSFSINSHAYGEAVYLEYPEPSTSDSQGYVVVGFDMDGVRQYGTFTWSLSIENLTHNTIEKLPMNINLGTDKISFSVNMDTSDSLWVTGYIGYYNNEGRYRILKTYDDTGPSGVAFTHNFSSGIVVKSYFAKGGVGSFSATSVNVYPGSIVFLGGVDGFGVINKLNNILTSSISIENKVLGMYNTLLPNMSSYLSNISANSEWIYDFVVSTNGYVVSLYNLLNGQIKTLLTNVDSKLQSIINHLGVQSAEDKQASDEFKENAQSQSNALNQATQESQTEKVDPNAAAGTIDGNLDFDAVGEYSNVLVVITNNSTVVTMMLIVMCVALISYVLFGKR